MYLYCFNYLYYSVTVYSRAAETETRFDVVWRCPSTTISTTAAQLASSSSLFSGVVRSRRRSTWVAPVVGLCTVLPACRSATSTTSPPTSTAIQRPPASLPPPRGRPRPPPLSDRIRNLTSFRRASPRWVIGCPPQRREEALYLEMEKNPNPARTNRKQNPGFAKNRTKPETEPKRGSYSVLSLNEIVGIFTHFTVNEAFYFI